MMNFDSLEIARIGFQISVWALPVLLAITLHEAAHGFVAWKLGDDTARVMGRVSFNPLRHIDLFGTVILPALLLLASGGRIMFGYAKPVPVDFDRLHRPRRDMVLVAAAGPGANLILLGASILLLKGLSLAPMLVPGPVAAEWIILNLFNSAWINAVLALFNLLPIPPLDGGRIAVGILPTGAARALARLERVGIFLILGALFVVPWLGRVVGLEINLFWWLVGAPAEYLVETALAAAGLR